LCLTDDSISGDVLIAPLEDANGPLPDGDAIRERIWLRYYHYYGRRYGQEEILEMLPRSTLDSMVFTHGDVAPRNIMVDEVGNITGILDWEKSGWYPDYWEYVYVHSYGSDIDWRNWMDQTAPERWDLSGITAVRRVLF